MKLVIALLFVAILVLGGVLVYRQTHTPDDSFATARSGRFTSADDAEQAAGFKLPLPRQPGWRLDEAVVDTGDLSDNGGKVASVQVNLKYERADTASADATPGFSLTIVKSTLAPELKPIDGAGAAQRIRIGGADAFLQSRDASQARAGTGTAYVQWRSGRLSLTAFAAVDQSFSVDDFLAVLDSIS